MMKTWRQLSNKNPALGLQSKFPPTNFLFQAKEPCLKPVDAMNSFKV